MNKPSGCDRVRNGWNVILLGLTPVFPRYTQRRPHRALEGQAPDQFYFTTCCLIPKAA